MRFEDNCDHREHQRPRRGHHRRLVGHRRGDRSCAGSRRPSRRAVGGATKWGMNGWSESLRQQLQPGVRVIVIEPGVVSTELTDHITHAETKAAAEEFHALVKALEPREIAEIVAFSVSRPRSVSLNEI